MIGKELLSAVFSSLTLLEILDGRIDDNVYYKVKEVYILQSINIHELAHKVKEWAINKNFTLMSSLDIEGGDCKLSFITIEGVIHKSFIADTEPEAIFKAGQWILDNK